MWLDFCTFRFLFKWVIFFLPDNVIGGVVVRTFAKDMEYGFLVNKEVGGDNNESKVGDFDIGVVIVQSKNKLQK